MFKALNLCNVICQFYLSKTGKSFSKKVIYFNFEDEYCWAEENMGVAKGWSSQSHPPLYPSTMIPKFKLEF